jgi:hypothetical protein
MKIPTRQKKQINLLDWSMHYKIFHFGLKIFVLVESQVVGEIAIINKKMKLL